MDATTVWNGNIKESFISINIIVVLLLVLTLPLKYQAAYGQSLESQVEGVVNDWTDGNSANDAAAGTTLNQLIKDNNGDNLDTICNTLGSAFTDKWSSDDADVRDRLTSNLNNFINGLNPAVDTKQIDCIKKAIDLALASADAEAKARAGAAKKVLGDKVATLITFLRKACFPGEENLRILIRSDGTLSDLKFFVDGKETTPSSSDTQGDGTQVYRFKAGEGDHSVTIKGKINGVDFEKDPGVDCPSSDYFLQILEADGQPSDLVVNPNEPLSIFAGTVDSNVNRVNLKIINPQGTILSEVEDSGQNIHLTFTPDSPGHWTIEADFLNGVVLTEGFDIPVFVIPESTIGVGILLVSSLAALGGFVLLKRRQGSNHSHSISDLGI